MILSKILLEAIDRDNSYQDALKIFNTLSDEEKWDVCPKSGFLKNVSTLLYRHVIKGKAFIDLYPYDGNKTIGFIILAVNPKYRHQGLTHQLLSQTISDSKQLGIKKLRWRCNSKNIGSFKAATSNGFKLTAKGKSYFSFELVIEHSHFFKAVVNGKEVGKYGLSFYEDIKAVGIGSFEIYPRYRNKGYGTAVIKQIIDTYKDKYDWIYCFVDVNNKGAIRFYKRIGKVSNSKNSKGQYLVTLYKK